MAIKVEKINEDGKKIVKEIEEGLYSDYIRLGWVVVEDKPKNDIFKQPKTQLEKLDKEHE